MTLSSLLGPTWSAELCRGGAAAGKHTSWYETVILGAGPAGIGPLVWAAQHGLLGGWLDSGVAIVERSQSGSSLGQYALNADSHGSSFLECLEGPHCEPPLTQVRVDPVTRELQRWRDGHPPLALVDRFQTRLRTAIMTEFARHSGSHVFTDASALAVHLQPDGSVVVLIATPSGGRQTIHAGSAVMALGGRPNTFSDSVEFAPGLDLARWRSKILPSHRLLKHGGAQKAGQMLTRSDRPPHAVIVGGSHSAFSSAWLLLERARDIRFGPHGVQILHRNDPRVTYYSRAEAHADCYAFSEANVCQATGRVHRLAGLQGDGRQLWRRMHGKVGTEPDGRAVATPIRDLSRAELFALLGDADVIVPALGYRMTTLPVFDRHGHPVPLARTGPVVGPDARLIAADGAAVPGVFGIGLGSGFVPWGSMAGELSFTGQQNSLWLYQHGLGEMIYRHTRQYAARRTTAGTPLRCTVPEAGGDHRETHAGTYDPGASPL